MKKLFAVFMALIFLSGCSKHYDKYDIEVFDAFDTVTSIVIYDTSKTEADEKLGTMKEKLLQLHKLFDRYNDYENINNVKTINDNAGIQPVKVDDELYYLIEKSMEYNETISDKVNILMGPVVDLWAEYRDLYNEGYYEDEVALKLGSALPTEEKLNSLRPLVDLSKIELNREEQSVFLKEKGMKLDLGACAKGYAVELLCEFGKEELKIESAIVSAGGNVKTIGSPPDKEFYKIAIQNPESIDDETKDPYMATLKIKENSIVTSGDYQRYFTYKGKKYCHIIDPNTFMPANEFRSVSIVEEDSLLCDYLSTALFLTDYEDGLKICKDLNVNVIWFFDDGEIKYTDGIKKMLED